MTKKQVFKIVLFITIFLSVLIPVTYMLRTAGTIKENFVGFYAEPKDSVDVIFIGSSPVYPCFSAPKLWGDYGITAYPLSTNVQRPKAIEYLIKEAEKTQNPKLYIIELRQFTTSDESMTENMAYTRGVTDNLKYSINRMNAINALVTNREERYTYYFDIFKYHSNWRSLILPEQISSAFYERKHPLKGYNINSNVAYGEKAVLSANLSSLPIPKDQEDTLYELLDYLNDYQMDALFVVCPKTLTEEQQSMFLYMQGIIEEKGYKYLNFNDYYDELKLDFATDFYDEGSHTNALGGMKCTEFLGEYIKENYKLPDHRGDSHYASWDEAFAYYNDCVDGAIKSIRLKAENGNYDEIVVD